MDQGMSKSGKRLYCMAGLHLWVDENIRTKRNGQRFCRPCHELAQERYKHKETTTGGNPTTGVPPWASSLGGNHHYHPTKPEPEQPIAPLVLHGAWGGPGSVPWKR